MAGGLLNRSWTVNSSKCAPPQGTGASDGRTTLPTITFVIPVRNDAVRLQRCLSTIQSNRYRGRIEILVIDNGSDDGSAEVGRQTGARVLVLPALPVSELRNRGAATAEGDILAFVDADHEIAPEWAAAAADSLQGERVGAVGAPYDAPEDGTWVQRTYDLLRRKRTGVHDTAWLGSGNMAVRRDSFAAVGGFDSTLQTCEDVDLCGRLRDSGYRVVEDSRLRSVHLGDPSSLGAVFRAELWRGRDSLRAAFKRPPTWRDLPSVVVPVIDLGLFGVALVGLSVPGAAGFMLSLTALAGILVGSAGRAARMVFQSSRVTAGDCARALLVAAVYDLARALSLVWPGGHEMRRGARA